MKKMFVATMLSSALFMSSAGVALADDMKASADYMPSLITETPLEGRQLAITMVRKTIGTIQKSAETKKKVRGDYQDDAALLMQAAELVAMEFRTIAMANNYWRKE